MSVIFKLFLYFYYSNKFQIFELLWVLFNVLIITNRTKYKEYICNVYISILFTLNLNLNQTNLHYFKNNISNILLYLGIRPV